MVNNSTIVNKGNIQLSLLHKTFLDRSVVFSGYSGFLHQKKNDRQDKTEILLKVTLNTTIQPTNQLFTQNRPQHMMLEKQFLASDRHKNVAELNRLMGSQAGYIVYLLFNHLFFLGFILKW